MTVVWTCGSVLTHVVTRVFSHLVTELPMAQPDLVTDIHLRHVSSPGTWLWCMGSSFHGVLLPSQLSYGLWYSVLTGGRSSLILLHCEHNRIIVRNLCKSFKFFKVNQMFTLTYALLLYVDR